MHSAAPTHHPAPAPPDPSVGRNMRALRTLEAGEWRISEKSYFPDRVMRRHAHELSNLTYVLCGGIAETAGRAHQVARAGAWVAKPAGTPHANRVGPAGARVLEIVHLAVPGRSRTLSYGWRQGGPEALRFLRIYGELRRAAPDAAFVVSGLCAELFPDPADGAAKGGAGPEWVCAVRDRLHDTEWGTAPLSELACAFQVHPTYLARVFRRRYGCSIGDYARALRVARAAGRLARQSAASVADIALAGGFADQSHLTRAFHALTGMTPAAYRALVRD